MILNTVISQNPFILKHILSTSTSETESQSGVNEALELIEKNVPEGGKIQITY